MSSTRLHYRFQHACGHTGIGPLICGTSCRTSPPSRDNYGIEKLTTIHLSLPFSCPFCPTSDCISTSTIAEVPLGQGVLTILSATYPWSWSLMRSCRYEEITPQDWANSTNENEGFRQMAWIPKPCGGVRVIGGLEEVRREGRVATGVITEVACAWRQREDEPSESRFAGMLSQLNAAVLSGERAGR